MSLIKDVINEVKALELSENIIRKFGIVVGSVFLLAALLFFWQHIFESTRIVFLVAGALLIAGGLFRNGSEEMKIVYRFWMAIAFFLGWILSRVILLVLFYLVLAPVGFIAKIFNKEFLDLKFHDGKESYWIRKEKNKIDYEKMF